MACVALLDTILRLLGPLPEDVIMLLRRRDPLGKLDNFLECLGRTLGSMFLLRTTGLQVSFPIVPSLAYTC